ncbi:MAG: hypothetical protein ACJAVK_000711 [Akkermansiaceae bacterium]|jgi:hypothetical protein
MAYSSSKDLRELLRDFLTGQNREESFRAVSERLSGLIYHAAYRQLGDATVAEEVTQNVLIQVSRKAGKHPEILAWMHEATRLEVLQIRSGYARRKKREEKAMKEMAGWFGKKGVTLSVVGLTTVLSTKMGKAAPVGLSLLAGGSQLPASALGGVGSGKLALVFLCL